MRRWSLRESMEIAKVMMALQSKDTGDLIPGPPPLFLLSSPSSPLTLNLVGLCFMTLLSYQVSSSFLWPVMATCTLPSCSNFLAQSLPSTYNASFISVFVNVIYFLRPSSSPTFFWNFLPLSLNSQGLAGSLLPLPANNC